MRLPTRTQVDRNVGAKHRSCTSTTRAPNLLHVLYIFIMFCKSSVDMFLHNKLSAHESESPLVVCVAYDILKRSPQPVLELDCAFALVAPVASVASVACDVHAATVAMHCTTGVRSCCSCRPCYPSRPC
jgi:hypothetical protein